MKTYTHVVAALATLVAFTTPAVAGTKSPCRNCTNHTEVMPEPTKVVNPVNLPRDFVKSTVEITLSVDENGVPSQIQVVSNVNREVAKQVVSAVSQWRFAPKYVDGQPVAGDFVLPLEITPTESV